MDDVGIGRRDILNKLAVPRLCCISSKHGTRLEHKKRFFKRITTERLFFSQLAIFDRCLVTAISRVGLCGDKMGKGNEAIRLFNTVK